PIEISPHALAACEKELAQIDMVSVVGHEKPYLEGLRTVADGRSERDHLLVLFLGSTIGNFDRDAGDRFLREMREILRPGDALLLGTDLENDFDLSCFCHEARWNYSDRRIEMHLRSTLRQSVRIPAASLRIVLDEDETIWTESSHKYKAEEIPEMAERTGFRCEAQWIDSEWP